MAEEEADSPNGPKRWTAKRRAALVLSILRGETSVAQAARQHALTVAERSSSGRSGSSLPPRTGCAAGLWMTRPLKTLKSSVSSKRWANWSWTSTSSRRQPRSTLPCGSCPWSEAGTSLGLASAHLPHFGDFSLPDLSRGCHRTSAGRTKRRAQARPAGRGASSAHSSAYPATPDLRLSPHLGTAAIRRRVAAQPQKGVPDPETAAVVGLSTTRDP